MIIRFGYVSTAVSLWDASPAKTLTFKRYSQLTETERKEKLLQVTAANLRNTMRMLYFNAAHDIECYRLSSSIVPLATHPEVLWDFTTPFRKEWQDIGQFIKANRMRVSFHPNQFTLFTSPRDDITENAVKDMAFHYSMLEAMGVEDMSYMNIHVGGAYGNKEESLERFHSNIKKLPAVIKEKMTLENDDKTYTAGETLTVCIKERIPFVFDYHHHLANPGEDSPFAVMEAMFGTWEHTGIPPKIHVSSPRSMEAYRAHGDFVDAAFIQPLILDLKKIGKNVDFMIEAKSKEQAMFQLIEDLTAVRGIKRISGAAIEI